MQMVKYVEDLVVKKLMALLDDYDFWDLEDGIVRIGALTSKDGEWKLWEGFERGLQLIAPVEMYFSWRNRRKLKAKWRDLNEYHFSRSKAADVAKIMETLKK